MEQEPKDTKILEMPSQGNPEEQIALESLSVSSKIDTPENPPQDSETKELAKSPIWKRAAKIRRLALLGLNGTETCRRLGITYAQYRHAVTWMTQKSFSSNAMAFNRYCVEVQSRIEQMYLDMMKAREDGDWRALAAFHKLGIDAVNGKFEMALKLGILDREAIKIDVTSQVGFGDENQAPWFAKKATPESAERVQ